MKQRPSAVVSKNTALLSIPSAGRTGMKPVPPLVKPVFEATFNTLSGSYRDEARLRQHLQQALKSTFNTLSGSYRDEAAVVPAPAAPASSSAFNTLSGSYRDEASPEKAEQIARQLLSIPSAGRTGMKPLMPCPGATVFTSFNTLSGSYRDEARFDTGLWYQYWQLSIPSAGRTGMKRQPGKVTLLRSGTLSIPSAGRTGMKPFTDAQSRVHPAPFNTLSGSYRDEAIIALKAPTARITFQYPQRVVPG